MTKQFNKTENVDHLISLMKDFGMSATDLSRKFHVADGTAANWLRDGQAPAWTLLAAEGLRRTTRKAGNGSTFLVISCPSKFEEALERLAQSLDAKVVCKYQTAE